MSKQKHKTKRPAVTGPKCPRDGRPGVEQGTSGIFVCTHCRGLFDAEPDEGGDFSTFNPAARLIREENRKERQR